jgi:hypothetical protein
LLRLQPRDTLSLRDRTKKHIHVFFALQAKPNLGALVKAHEIGSEFVAFYFYWIPAFAGMTENEP